MRFCYMVTALFVSLGSWAAAGPFAAGGSGGTALLSPKRDTAWTAVVIGVRADLGMIVMDVGSSDGVRPGMRYEVRRGSETIAGVRVVDVRERIAGAALIGDGSRGVPAVGDNLVLVIETE